MNTLRYFYGLTEQVMQGTIRLCFFILVLFGSHLQAQNGNRIGLKGRVEVARADAAGIYVANRASGVVVQTDQEGMFEINAKVGDALCFVAPQFKEFCLTLTADDLKKEFLTVFLKRIVNELDEVVVQEKLSASSLGIIPKGQKVYTPAERKLYTATHLNASANAGTMAGGSISADPLLNWISGRTKMLKKELQVEKKERYLQQTQALFSADYVVNKLKIPADYVKGFEYFAIEDPQFVSSLQSKNTSMSHFLINDLAFKYKKILSEEN
ncbi:MAG: hypothetical protein ACK4M4_04865 [Flavobacterium sp.]